MNYFMQLSYNGKNYHGFARQPNVLTVQGELERAIFEITGERVETFGSGRTDAGVHAVSQCVSFKLQKPFDEKKIKFALNAKLPEDIRVFHSCAVTDDFHARFSAKRKTYLYQIENSEVPTAFMHDFCLFVQGKLHLSAMRKAARQLVGHHDFTSFCGSDNQSETFDRTVYQILIKRKKNFITISVTGNGFLNHMVRIIVGTLLEVGRKQRTPQSMRQILAAKDRTKAGKTVAAKGLFLKQVEYASHFFLTKK